MKIENLEFITKLEKEQLSKAVPEKKDISITVCKDGSLNISIRPSAIDRLLTTGKNKEKQYEYLMFAFNGGRLYFKGTNNTNAFLICRNKLTKNVYCKVSKKYIPQDLNDWISINSGKHQLKLDADSKLYYIDGNGIEFILKGQ